MRHICSSSLQLSWALSPVRHLAALFIRCSLQVGVGGFTPLRYDSNRVYHYENILKQDLFQKTAYLNGFLTKFLGSKFVFTIGNHLECVLKIGESLFD